MVSQKVRNRLFLSFPRRRESRKSKNFWTPAFAGVTTVGTFYESIKIDELVKSPKSPFPSFRRKPESSLSIELQETWTPVFTGVTTFYESINIKA